MIRRVVYHFLKSVINDIFVDVDVNAFHLSGVSDIFSCNTVSLHDLKIRTDIFDIIGHPLRLEWGSIGKLEIDGIADLSLGSLLTITVDNVFLLFSPHDFCSVDFAQTLKKVVIEYFSSPATINHFKDLILHALGQSIDKTTMTTKQSEAIWKIICYILKNIAIKIKTTHIRVEIFPQKDSKDRNHSKCHAIGLTIPLMRLGQNLCRTMTQQHSYHNKEAPCTAFSMKEIQLYCDYNVDSYLFKYTSDHKQPGPSYGTNINTTLAPDGGSTSTSSTSTSASPWDIMMKEFLDRWRTEVHTAILLPFDLDSYVSFNLGTDTSKMKLSSAKDTHISDTPVFGHLTLTISINITRLRVACDSTQLETLLLILNIIDQYSRRYKLLCALPSCCLRAHPIPTARASFTPHPHSFSLLPRLTVAGQSYPEQISLLQLSSDVLPLSPLQQYSLKARSSSLPWTKVAWHFAYKAVLHDLRTVAKNTGKLIGGRRWATYAVIAADRKHYAFIYSKYFKVYSIMYRNTPNNQFSIPYIS